MDRICVSLDGSTESKYDKIREKGMFQKTISGIVYCKIKLATKWKNKKKTSQRGKI